MKSLIEHLRKRRDEVPLRVEHFLRKYAHVNRKICGISSDRLKVRIDFFA